jgi:hypothetical protein
MAFESGNLSEEEMHEQRLAVLEARAAMQEAEARLIQIQSQLEANE